LTINDGTAQTGNTGVLNVGALNMTGGLLKTGTAGHGVNLNGNVTAQSDALSGAATISGTGALSLNGSPRTFTINDGPAAVDLDVQVPIVGPGTPGLIKAGAGRL